MLESRNFSTLDECNDFLVERFDSKVKFLESECLKQPETEAIV